ncbi:flagellar basal body L-ring protein FlgH [Alcaligenes faecalis]|uniref:flagellar basal body L-ring protein FlgH n=1 Tax=Alcaligenes faecalis TaxID=511 RepID=UPI00208E3C73|nr:flagellar basal body L-ring protein FlgH [Alcaligenes faecalis]USP49092.1 flagellar basal body L-ring protein FlgH [Alcaligenes faecalis]
MFQALLSRLALGALVVLSGCALVPPEDVVTGPLTAAPPPAVPAAVVANGSIYQPSAYGNYPLFEDRRPRNVGDIVTIMIQERTNAAKNVSTNTDRTGSGGLDFTGVPAFLPNEVGSKQNFEVSGSNKAQGKGSSRADNTFSGTLTTTVVGVLPNGNLQVAGEKQIAINRGSEHIRFSGVVDPRSITGSNTVSSTQVADARIEFRSKGVMDEVQTMGWLQRFFLNISPF